MRLCIGLVIFMLMAPAAPVFAQEENSVELQDEMSAALFDEQEYNPFDPDVEKLLEAYDLIYEFTTGKSAYLEPQYSNRVKDCYRDTCAVWARVSKEKQKMDLFVNGEKHTTWVVSSGAPGNETPQFDRHPDGRIYDAYTSSKYPGGDYMGLGNMPYAVFIKGGFAMHGTPKANWKILGKKASHGCIRLHPENAKIFNRLVREHGIEETWITVK
ncbi:MAG: L,D-transpeptidase [Bdellovibrionaceae bacterium]|nr:L,D-transpeptidase [Pseudobdellovibrionaceae bacterium]